MVGQRLDHRHQLVLGQLGHGLRAGVQGRRGAGVLVVDAQQHLPALEPARLDAGGVVAGEAVVHRPGGAVEAAAVHRARRRPCPRARRAAAAPRRCRASPSAPSTPGRDSAVISRSSRPAPVGHRHRVGAGGQRAPGGVVGRHEEDRAALGQQPLRPLAAGVGLRDRLGPGCAGLQQLAPLLVTDLLRHHRAPSGSVVLTGRATGAAAHGATPPPGDHRLELLERGHRVGAGELGDDDRTGGVAVLGDPHRVPAREQPVHQRPAERVTGAEPADDVDQLRRRRCARRRGVATSTPSAPFLTRASSTPWSSSRRAASSGSAVPTATSTSARLPTTTVTCSSISSYSRRASCGDGQNIGRQSRSRHGEAPVGGVGAAPVGEHVELGLARGLGRHARPGHPQHRDVAHEVPRHVVLGEGEVGRDRQSVEEQRRVLGRVERAEDDRRQQLLGGADVRRVDPEPLQRLPGVRAELVRARPW